jgi:ATP-dependent helicase HrpA
VLPLFGRLSTRDQERIFESHAQRRIVLATNVAETSLTVPGIRHVIDTGLARISRFSARGQVQRLPIERISRASAEQRKGRCGREAPGICIRLYSEEDFAEREAFTAPEVLRTNLASVILRMATAGLGEPETYPFLDPPDVRRVKDGVRLLQELKAMDEARRVTSLGRQIATLPVDPRLGRMLLAASQANCLAEMLIVTSFLETQDPRERPTEAQQLAAEKQALFADARSDFATVLNLWARYHEQAGSLSRNQLRRWCREHFLSFVRMREWEELHAQLHDAIRELRLRINSAPAGYPRLHQALLTGFLGSVGALDARREYAGPRGVRFVIAPGTPLASRPPRWIVAGSLVETTRLYARMVADVKPAWIETAAAHLVTRTYREPHWVAGAGFVAAYETVSLFGLTLVAARRVNYGGIQPREARDLFIREALVSEPAVAPAPDLRGTPPARVAGEFLSANRALRAQLESLEAKIRRRDILVDDQAQIGFYARLIPERVNSVAAFEHWRRDAERTDPRLLFMSPADLMLRQAPDAAEEHFPETLAVGANRLPLRYTFAPGEPDDGITLTVPQPLLELLDAQQLAWLVPGLRLEKITELFRALPKAQRKLLVPVPDSARAALATVLGDAQRSEAPLPGFYTALADWLSRQIGSDITAAELARLPLPAHLRMNVRVVDADDRVLAEGRDLAPLRAASAPPVPAAAAVYRHWDFETLPESREIERNRLQLRIFPALQDRGNGVVLMEAATAAEAARISRAGIARLAMLALPEQLRDLKKRFANDRELTLLSRGLPLAQSPADALTQRAFTECILPEAISLPRSRAEFDQLLQQRRAGLHETAEQLAATVLEILREWRAARSRLQALTGGSYGAAVADVEAQLAGLLTADFIEATPQQWLAQLPRYLRAIAKRLERLPANVRRDSELAGKVQPFAAALRVLTAKSCTFATRAHIEQLRWMIEEFRVSLFAQELKTLLRVSDKRLAAQLQLAAEQAR